MYFQVVTISVSDLTQSRQFYEGILGFEPDIYYEPTRWQSYKLEGTGGFGIIEQPDLKRDPSMDIVNFVVDDVESLWNQAKDQVKAESELQLMPWGTHKFVVLDPDGLRIGVVGKEAGG